MTIPKQEPLVELTHSLSMIIGGKEPDGRESEQRCVFLPEGKVLPLSYVMAFVNLGLLTLDSFRFRR